MPFPTTRCTKKCANNVLPTYYHTTTSLLFHCISPFVPL